MERFYFRSYWIEAGGFILTNVTVVANDLETALAAVELAHPYEDIDIYDDLEEMLSHEPDCTEFLLGL